jgi:hypothetical protein
MRMMLVIVLEPLAKLGHYRFGVWPIIDIDIVSFECLYKRLCHAVALRTVSRSAARNEVDGQGKAYCFLGQVIQGIIIEPFNFVRQSINRTKSVLQALRHQISYHLCVYPAVGSHITDKFPVTTIQAEGDPNHFSIPAGDLKDIGTPPEVAIQGDNFAIMRPNNTFAVYLTSNRPCCLMSR